MSNGAQRAHAARDHNHRVHWKRAAGNAGANVVVVENLNLFPAIAYESFNHIAQRHRASQLLVKHPQPSRRDDKLNSGHTGLGCEVIQETLWVNCAAGAGDGNGNVHAKTGLFPPGRPYATPNSGQNRRETKAGQASGRIARMGARAKVHDTHAAKANIREVIRIKHS